MSKNIHKEFNFEKNFRVFKHFLNCKNVVLLIKVRFYYLGKIACEFL